MRKVLAIARKEMRQTLRDVPTLLVVLLVPLLLLSLYGYALNFDIRHVPLAVQDRDGTRESREIVAAFINSGYFDQVASTHADVELRRLLDENVARLVLVVPEGVGRDLRNGRDARVQVLINGDNANTATTVMGYSVAIVRGVSASLRVQRLGPAAAAAAPVTLEPRVWFNPQLESTLFLVPGLIAFIAMLTAVIQTALSIVREKERGTMEQVRMAPVSTAQYVVGKMLPYLVLSLLSATFILLAAMALFGMPMRGSWWLLMAVTLVFLASALGLGLFISTLADSQQVAFQIALLVSFLPTFILSGFVFPIASMPSFVQVVTHIVPARYYLVALRGIALKGVGLAYVWPQVVALLVFTALVMALAAVRLRRQAAG